MEGKNCFRQRWAQEPLYSGGNISSLVIKTVYPGTEARLVDANTTTTGDATTAVYVPNNLEDKKGRSVFDKIEGLVMACGDEVNLVDAVTGERLAAYQTLMDDQVLNVASIYVSPAAAATAAANSALSAPAGSYIAISTRSLQVVVFEVKQEVEIVTEMVAVPKEKKQKKAAAEGEAEEEEETDNAAAAEEESDDEEEEKVEVTRASFTERFYLKQVQAWTASQHAVAMLLFSPCGSYLLTGSTVGNIKGWNVFHHHLTHNMTMVGGGFITSMALSSPISNTAVIAAAGGATSVLAKSAKRKETKKAAADKAAAAAAATAEGDNADAVEGAATAASAWGSSLAAANNNSASTNTATGIVPQFLAVGTAEGHVAVFNFATTKAIFATTQPHVSPVDALVFVEGVMTSKGETKKGAITLQQEWRLISAGRDRKCVSNQFVVDINDVAASPSAANPKAVGEVTYTTSNTATLEEVRAVAFPEFSNCATFESRHKLHVGTIDGVVSTYAVDNNGRLSHLHRSPKPRGAGNIENLDDELTIKCVVVAATRKALKPDEEVTAATGAVMITDESTTDATAANEEEDTGRSCVYAADATFCINHYTCRPGTKTITPTYTLIGHLDQILDIKLLDKPAIAQAAERSRKRREAREAEGDFDDYSSDSSSSDDSSSNSDNDDAADGEDDGAAAEKKDAAKKKKGPRKLRAGPIHNCRRLIITNTKVPRIFDGVGCVSTEYLEGHNDIVMCAAISNDGKFLATGAKDKTVRLWDAKTLRCLAIGKEASQGVRGHTNEITGLVFSAKPTESYQMLYSVGADEMMCAWDPLDAINNTKPEKMISEISTTSATPNTLAVMEPRHAIASIHDGPVHGLAIAPNDQFLATCSKDKVVTVWNIIGKKLFKEAGMKGHKRAVTAVCFSPTDRVLASCANDATVRLWSLASFSCVKTLQHESQKPILQLSFFNKGLQLVSTDAEGTLSVWALSTSEVITNLELHKEKVWALNVIESKDLKTTLFVSGAADGSLCVTEDYTAEEALRLRQEHDETIMKEQQLANAMRLGEFENAFRLALRLNHPRHLRQVISRWLAVNEEEVESVVSHSIFPSLSVEDTNRLLEFMREWMTNARYCHIASMLLHCLFTAFHFTEIERMRGLRTVLEAFVSYSNRHAQRMTQSLQRMYFIDYICRGQKAQHGGGLSLLAPYCSLVTKAAGTAGAAAEQSASVAASSAAARQKESAAEQQKALERQHMALLNGDHDDMAAANAVASKVIGKLAADSTAATLTAPASKKKARVEGSGSFAGSSNSHQAAAEEEAEEGQEGAGLMRGRVRPVPPPRDEGFGYGRGGRGSGGRGGGGYSSRGGSSAGGDRRQSVSGYQGGSSFRGGRGGSSSEGGSFRGRGGSDSGFRGRGGSDGGFRGRGSSSGGRGGSFRGGSRGGSRGGFKRE